MSKITDHIDQCAADYVGHASPNPDKYTKEFVIKELDEWVERLFNEGAIKDVQSGWVRGTNKYQIHYRPADAECHKITQTLVFAWIKDDEPDTNSSYDRAMSGL